MLRSPVSFAPAIAAVLLLLAPIADAQEVRDSRLSLGRVPHVSGDYDIDGVLDEAFWQQALRVEIGYETSPGENVAAPVTTSAYIAENGTHLLIGFDARDPEPELIRAYLRDRDTAWQDDIVGIAIDTFNDQLRGYQFFANAFGVQIDTTLDDVTGNNDDSWNAIWDSMGAITDTGFTVEMAIPFSQIRFPGNGRLQTWGIDFMRMYPRADRHRLALNPELRGRNCSICQFSTVTGFEGAEAGADIEVVPSLTASRTDLRDSSTGRLVSGPSDSEVGVDVSWGITPDITANLAINPDFSQVEADSAQFSVNNNFALRYPEKRPFFLEGASFFETPLQAVFTRTIADPDLGAKLTGRADAHAYGVFVARDTITNLLIPGPLGSISTSLAEESDSVVGRYQYDFGRSSAIGMLVTHRESDSYSNTVAGIDGRYRLSDKHSLTFQYLDSDTEYPDAIATSYSQPAEGVSGAAREAAYEFSARNWIVQTRAGQWDAGFRADSGFMTQVGVDYRNVNMARIWHGTEHSWWNRVQIGMNVGSDHFASGQLLNRFREHFFVIQGPRQMRVQSGFGSSKQYWNGQLYDGDFFFVSGNARPIGPLELNASIQRSEQIDYANSRLGDQRRESLRANWNVNRRLSIRASRNYSTLDTQEGPEIFAAVLDDLRVTWQFNVRSFIRLTMQRQEVDRNLAVWNNPFVDAHNVDMGSQFLYSYKLNPQTVVYAGYSDTHVENDDLLTLTKTSRTFFLKFSYAWLP